MDRCFAALTIIDFVRGLAYNYVNCIVCFLVFMRGSYGIFIN